MTGEPATLFVFADGGSRGNPGIAGYGALVVDEAGKVLAKRSGPVGVATNNVAEYNGLISGLQAAAAIDPGARVHVRMDSKLVVEQMSGRWQIKHPDMRRLADDARRAFEGPVTYEWIPRAQNVAADQLANNAMDSGEVMAWDADSPVEGVSATASRGSPAPAPAPAPALAQVATDAAAHRVFSSPARPPGAAPRFSSDPPLTLVLVRHGPTAMTVAGAFSGSGVAGPSLTAHGRTTAAQAADLIYRIGRDKWADLPTASAVVASPMVRTQETAAAVGRRLGLPVATDLRFAEVHFGAWEGRTLQEIDSQWPGGVQQWQTTGTMRPPAGSSGGQEHPEGESYFDVAARVWAGFDDLVRAGVGRTVVVVGHTIQVRAAVGQALGIPPGRWSWLRIPPASVTILRRWLDGMTEVTALGVPSS